MRQKRAKTYKRVMALYTQAFGFRQPYQVLVANDLLTETAKQDLDIYKQLSQCVQGETKPMITQCCMQALYKLGKDFQNVVNVAKGFERRRCNHREAIDPEDCLKDVVGATNKHRYILAIQSPSLLKSLTTIPGLPLIHFNPRHVLVLSPPSTATVRLKNKAEEERRLEGGKVLEGLEEGENVIKDGAGGAPGSGSGSGSGIAGGMMNAAKRGGRKVKGVNPLSAKKKKKVNPLPSATTVSTGAKTIENEAGPSTLVTATGEEQTDSGKSNKRTRSDELPGEALDRPSRDHASDAEGEGLAGDDGERKKRKRKRRGKGVVADAIAELNAGAGESLSEGDIAVADESN